MFEGIYRTEYSLYRVENTFTGYKIYLKLNGYKKTLIIYLEKNEDITKQKSDILEAVRIGEI